MEHVTQWTSAGRPTSSCSDSHSRSPHPPDTELLERLHTVDSVITLRVGHPLTRVEAVVLQHQVQAFIARRPAAIVLDVAGLMPIDEMGMLMLPAMVDAAAGDGIAVALAHPSRSLCDRLAQLGVHNLTFINWAASTAPTEDDAERSGHRVTPPPPGPQGSTGSAATTEFLAPCMRSAG